MTNQIVPSNLDSDIVPNADDQQAVVDDLKESLKQYAELLSDEMKRRMDTPARVKKTLRGLHIVELAKEIAKIITALKKPNAVIMTKALQVNLQQVNKYTNAIANDPSRRKELREQARRQLRNIPT